MLRGTFLVLLCGLMLFVAAPLGHADGGAPESDAPGQDASDAGPTASDGAGPPSVNNPFLFIDVPDDHWAVADLKYLVEYGVITGLPNGAYHGDNYLTRYSAAAMVARALRLMQNNPDLVTQEDLGALQDLLFQLGEQIEQHDAQIAALQGAPTARPETAGADPALAAQLTQTSERLNEAEVALRDMQQELNQLKRDVGAPAASLDAEQLTKLKQQANANFIIAIASLFVGIIGIALATMT